MKPAQTIATGALLAFLLAAPFVGSVFAASITVSTDQMSYSDAATIHITGSVTPAPSGQAVVLSLTNPTGTTIVFGNAPVSSSDGSFTSSLVAGGTYFQSSGTYTITASLGPDSGKTTFTYTAAPSGGGGGISQAQFNDIMGNLTAIKNVLATLQSGQTSQNGQLTGIQGSLTSIASQLTSITNSLAGVTTAVNAAGTSAANAATAAQNAQNAVASTQTYVLVVAALAAITLVLELAILVRRLS